ncbi:MAG: linear amide C-N hydrolase [Acidimicrobiales bacterium]
MCTNFKHPAAKDGTVCVGRTMEFPDVLPWELAVLARDHQGTSGSGPKGKTWTGKYGVVGMAGFGQPWFSDAMNSAGLSGHLLYMPDHATYYDAKNDGSDIGILETLAFLLGTCSSTAEAKAALAGCNVVDWKPKEVPIALPLHIILHDKDSCVVAEFHPEGMVVSDNPVQVATNAPYLEWHLTNVANYLSLTPDNPKPVTIGGTTFAPSGQGQGFRGLPADENSPSRFIRVLANSRFAQQSIDSKAAEMDTVRILHGFDLVPGTVMEETAGGLMPLLTMWSTVCNLTDNRYIYSTINDPQWYVIDLNKTDFATTRSVAFTTTGSFTTITV